MITENHVFTKNELNIILQNVLDKTLGEVDVKNVFRKTIAHPKVTGIAGDVIEQSVLGYPADSRQEADLLVDGLEVELKTTGIRESKKQGIEYEAKEPMSITAVSPEHIVSEDFASSHFWGKLERLLLVYYLYDSESTVRAAEYANFPIKGYHFYEFDEEDKRILENDWNIVRNFISDIQTKYDSPEVEYPRLSSELREELMLIDTSPKWPNRPRFRLKRATVSTIVQEYFGERLEQLDETYSTFKEIDEKLHDFTQLYSNKTIEELIKPECLNIKVSLNKKDDVSKSIAEQIVVKMFGGDSKKLNKIELFRKLGLVAKTIVKTTSETRTEDTKMFPIDFDEWLKSEQTFEDSTVYSEFSENQFLFIVFEEPSSESKLLENKFIGFKRIAFNEDFIEHEVRRCWSDTRNLIFSKKLKETVRYNRDGTQRMNRNGTISTSVNFPKSSNYDVFVRGTGEDSSNKPLVLNGIKMYKQNVWIKGSVILELLNSKEYI
jgi:hypothetical protein